MRDRPKLPGALWVVLVINVVVGVWEFAAGWVVEGPAAWLAAVMGVIQVTAAALLAARPLAGYVLAIPLAVANAAFGLVSPRPVYLPVVAAGLATLLLVTGEGTRDWVRGRWPGRSANEPPEVSVPGEGWPSWAGPRRRPIEQSSEPAEVGQRRKTAA